MDIDVLRVSGKAEWKRLDELTRTRNLSGEEIDELDRLYRSATTDLARVRTSSPDPDVIADLSRTLSAARGRLAGTGGLTGASDPVSDSVGDPGRHGRVRRAWCHPSPLPHDHARRDE